MRKTSDKFALIVVGIVLYAIANVVLADDTISFDDNNVNFRDVNPQSISGDSKERYICVNSFNLVGNHSHKISISGNNDQGRFYLESENHNKIYYTVNFIDRDNTENQEVHPNDYYGLVYKCRLGQKKSKLQFIIPVSSLGSFPTAGKYTATLTVSLSPPNETSAKE